MQSAVATATAVAIGLVVLGRTVALRRREDESLRESIRALQESICELQAEQQASISALWASQSVTFIVAQYNILASYLGDNPQPWFLHGLPAGSMPDARREAIMTKFYERDQHGKLVNIGWPHFVKGLLSDQEQRQVEACNERYFVWNVRSTKLLDTVLATGADVISLVELDLRVVLAAQYAHARLRLGVPEAATRRLQRRLRHLLAAQPLQARGPGPPRLCRPVRPRDRLDEQRPLLTLRAVAPCPLGRARPFHLDAPRAQPRGLHANQNARQAGVQPITMQLHMPMRATQAIQTYHA